jgi:hypothetical protein
MSREGSLKEVLAAVPEPYGVVWAPSRQFVPRPDDGSSFAERMTVRLAPPAAINDPISPYRPNAKAAHRADPDVTVVHGGHSAHTRFPPLRDWYPADVLHFPYRTLEQYERKNARRAHGVHSLGQYVRGLKGQEQGRLEEVYGALVVGDSTLAKGLAAGFLVVDTRLRDALRLLAGASTRPYDSNPREGAPRNLRAIDAAVLLDADVVRLFRSVDDLRARLDAIEARAGAGASSRRSGAAALRRR